MVAIGRQLRRQGHEVVISLAEPYVEVAESAGLIVEPVISREEFETVLDDPAVWKPIRGVWKILNQVAADFTSLHDAVIRKHHRPGDTILVSHPLDFASRVFREQDSSTPLVDVHLAPATIRVPSAPARLSPWWFEVSRPEWAVKASYWIADRLVIDRALSPAIEKLRQQYGLPRISRYVDQWWLSPDRILAMYTEWFAPESARASDQLRFVGFPLDDGWTNHRGNDEQEFDDAPIVFTAGTAHQHSKDFFRQAVDACSKLNRPGLLLSTHRDNFPASLPSFIKTLSFAPLGQLLPKASAIVHHGGIGTTSQAFVSGIPQIVRPNAFDQFDNATRVQRLGCGLWLRKDRELAEAIGRVLNDSGIKNRCEEVAGRFSSNSGACAVASAEEIERLYHARRHA